MNLERLSETVSHGGRQGIYRHLSSATGTAMTFSLFLPPQATRHPVPLLLYLSGLTCTHANVTEKGEYRAACAVNGIAFLAPDTSPRGESVADDPAYDLGQGAGFYLDATEPPWAGHFRMESYVMRDLLPLVGDRFPLAMDRVGITGHSMGGHGALTLALRHPYMFRSVSAFAPIVAPGAVPWGQKAFAAYLGTDRTRWRAHDACVLIEDGAQVPELLVDQGGDDPFLAEQLRPDRLDQACAAAGIALTCRIHPGYDHSYYFVSTFMGDHVAWHSARLVGQSANG